MTITCNYQQSNRHTHNHFSGEPEETFTHSHLSWSSIIPYLLLPSNMIHGILPVQSSSCPCFSAQKRLRLFNKSICQWLNAHWSFWLKECILNIVCTKTTFPRLIFLQLVTSQLTLMFELRVCYFLHMSICLQCFFANWISLQLSNSCKDAMFSESCWYKNWKVQIPLAFLGTLYIIV